MNDAVIDSNISGEHGMTITAEIRGYLTITAKWAFFLSIVGFVSIALMVIMGIFMGTMVGSMLNQFPPGMGPPGIELLSGGLFTGVFSLTALLYFFPTLYLFRFAKLMKVALANDDQLFLSDSFKNLKSLFKFIGILTVITIILYVISIIASIIIGIAGASMM